MNATDNHSKTHATGGSIPLVAGMIGAALMTACLGVSIVDPTQFEWLMHGDYSLHFLGWHLYRHGPWTMPPGGTPLLIWPIGSSIGLTDSIPILGIPLKLLDALLPPVFQYIGAWLVLSVALQGVFGALLMRLVTPNRWLQLLGALLVVLSPPLFYRINHAALTAHWVVLASLWLALHPAASVPSRRVAVGWALLCAITAAIQPYLWFMVVVLMAAGHGRQLLTAPRGVLAIAASGALSLAASYASLWASGSLMVRADDGLEIGGFGVWSTNLLAFIMPTEGPTLLSPGLFRYEHREQYEGYAYLGLGMLLLAVLAIGTGVMSIRRLRWPQGVWRHAPLAIALLFLAAMALGPQVTAGAQTLFTYDRSWWGPLRIFRTSGRMVWPVYYITVIGVLSAASRWHPRRAIALLTAALVIQAVDLVGMAGYVRDVRNFGFRDPLVSRFWETAPRHYDGFELIPSNLCASEGYLDFNPFALHAGLEGIGVNGGMTARYDVRRAREYCEELGREIRHGLDADRSLYVVRPDLVPEVRAFAGGGLACALVDGFGVCFTPESAARWTGSYDLARSRLPDAAELMRFYEALDDAYATALGRGAVETPGPAEVRVEALVSYLAYRREGCAHAQAAQHVASALAGGGGTCVGLAPQPTMPPANETFAFRQQLEDILRTRPGAATSATHVDAEGEAVWLQAYVDARIDGAGESEARAAVLEAVRGAR